MSVEKAIPRRIIQSWVDRNLTPGVVDLCKSHRNCNPGYEYVFYDDEECRDFIKEHFHVNVLHAYDALIPGPFKADLFRYCELYVNGGWWFDIDTMSVGSIDSIIGPEVEFACPRDLDCVRGGGGDSALYQAVLGVGAGHPVTRACVARIASAVSQPYKALLSGSRELFRLSGPVRMGREFNRWLGNALEGAIVPGDCPSGCSIGASSASSGQLTFGGRSLAIGHGGAGGGSARQARVQRAYDELFAHADRAPADYSKPHGVVAGMERDEDGLVRILR